MTHRSEITSAMMNALGSLPVTLVRKHGVVALPMSSPPGSTLKALERRDLAKVDGDRWVRTPLGESVWAHR